jgi:hypothetical protein
MQYDLFIVADLSKVWMQAKIFQYELRPCGDWNAGHRVISVNVTAHPHRQGGVHRSGCR